MSMRLIASHNSTRQGAIRYEVCACLLLVLVTLSAYRQVGRHDFINFDDNVYVYENSHVRSGLTPESLAWSIRFQEKDRNYWQPLTWLSHMLDVELYGLEPGRHHLTNVLFHAINTVLLFAVLQGMTGAFWRSAFVAAVFALHPLNVESVAWVSERKNVLSTFFWLLTLLAYTHYTRQTGLWRYLTVCFFLTLGLLTKPMLVTLPFVLMLFDFWPLRRWAVAGANSGGRRASNTARIMLEKVPFLVLSTFSVYISSKSVQAEGDVVSFQIVPLLLRIENALVSYVRYMAKMFWPQNLSVFYPLPDTVSGAQVLGAVIILMSISVLAIWGLKRRPYFAVGWFWFMGTLVPVIGLVQVGLWPAMADRWAYVPLIGLFIIIAWGVPDLLKRWRPNVRILAAAAGTVLLLLSISARTQISYWTDSITLFKHAIQAVGGSSRPHNKLGNAFIYNNLALALMANGRYDEAHENLVAAVKLAPESARVHYNLASVLLQQGKTAEAVRNFQQTVKLNPEYYLAHYNLAAALMMIGKFDQAISNYQSALELTPDNKEVLNDLANALSGRGRITDALAYYDRAIRLDPMDPEIHNNLGVTLVHAGKIKEAIEHFRLALQLNPGYADAQNNLRHTLKMQP